MPRRIGKLDTPDRCLKECEQVYRRAWKEEISWRDANEATEVLERMSNMSGGDREQGEGKFSDVGKNAIRR